MGETNATRLTRLGYIPVLDIFIKTHKYYEFDTTGSIPKPIRKSPLTFGITHISFNDPVNHTYYCRNNTYEKKVNDSDNILD